MVTCNQPFEEVEQPELRRLLEYTHLRPSLHIPSSTTISQRVMKMGEDTIEGVKQLVAVSFYNDGYRTSQNLLAFYIGPGRQGQPLTGCLDIQ